MAQAVRTGREEGQWEEGIFLASDLFMECLFLIYFETFQNPCLF